MVAKALINIGGTPAIDALIDALKNGDESTREIAANSLGDSGDKNVISLLLTAEKDSCEAVRKAARKSLEKMKSIE
jgi:HEAT repeat protein